MADCHSSFVHFRGDISSESVCVPVCTCVASLVFPSYSSIMEALFHCDDHWENAVGSRDRAEDPYNLTHRISENITQSKELSSVSARATLIM